MAQQQQFICVFQPPDTVQAGMVRSALEDSGIPCYVNNENMSGLRFGGLATGAAAMQVMVPENQMDDALQIIRELGFQ